MGPTAVNSPGGLADMGPTHTTTAAVRYRPMCAYVGRQVSTTTTHLASSQILLHHRTCYIIGQVAKPGHAKGCLDAGTRG